MQEAAPTKRKNIKHFSASNKSDNVASFRPHCPLSTETWQRQISSLTALPWCIDVGRRCRGLWLAVAAKVGVG